MKQLIERYYSKKGFKNAKVEIREIPDLSKENHVMLQVDVDRSNKIKVHKIYINGNKVMSDSKVKRAMKKTNENGNLLNLFKQKKFVEQDFADDLNRIVEKYNELGYRDAKILNDSVARYNDKSVDVFIDLEEGDKYYISDIQWVGNTVYDTDVLNNAPAYIPATSTTEAAQQAHAGRRGRRGQPLSRPRLPLLQPRAYRREHQRGQHRAPDARDRRPSGPREPRDNQRQRPAL